LPRAQIGTFLVKLFPVRDARNRGVGGNPDFGVLYLAYEIKIEPPAAVRFREAMEAHCPTSYDT
jgi:hypothetical protein